MPSDINSLHPQCNEFIPQGNEVLRVPIRASGSSAEAQAFRCRGLSAGRRDAAVPSRSATSADFIVSPPPMPVLRATFLRSTIALAACIAGLPPAARADDAQPVAWATARAGEHAEQTCTRQ